MLHYSALAAGSSLLPITVIMLTLSSRTARLGQRIGPRWPMTVGPMIIAAGLVLLSRLRPGDSYVSGVLGGVVVVVRRSAPVAPVTQPAISHACSDPCVREHAAT